MSAPSTLTSPAAVDEIGNGPTHYGRLSRVLHWTVAILVVAAVALGLITGTLERGSAIHETYIQLHKSIGLTVLVLMTVRLSWILRSPAPKAAPALAVWERRLAWTVHKLLYVALFAMPLTGLLLSQAAFKDTVVFGLFTLPPLLPLAPPGPTGPGPVLALAVRLHKTVFELSLYALLALHLLGVAKHVLIDRDPEAFLRMWRRPRA